MYTKNHAITAGQDAAESFPTNAFEELIQRMESSGSPMEIKEGLAFLKKNPWYVKALKADTLDHVWGGCTEELRR